MGSDIKFVSIRLLVRLLIANFSLLLGLVLSGIIQGPLVFQSIIFFGLLAVLLQFIWQKNPGSGLNLTISLSALVLFLVVSELFLRLWIPLSEIYQNPSKALIGYSLQLTNMYSLKPNTDFTMDSVVKISAGVAVDQKRPIRIITDSRGLRNKKELDSSVDTIILGDSFAMGMANTEGETFRDFLEEQTGEKVYNAAFPGSPATQYRRLETLLPTLKTTTKKRKLLWLIFPGNDLYETYEVLYQKVEPTNMIERGLAKLHNFQKDSRVFLILRNFFTRNSYDKQFLTKTIKPYGDVYFHRPTTDESARELQAVYKHPNWPRLQYTIKKVKQLATQYKLELTIAIIPAKSTIYLPEYAELPMAKALLDFCKEEAINCLDLTPCIQTSATIALENKELLWWPDDTHWNLNGQKTAVNCLYQSR